MAEPLEINISKSFVEHGGKQWATYENGGGVTVQVWKNQQLELQLDLSYTDYATFREKAPELGLRDYPAPLMRRQGGTNANGNTLGRVVGETAPTAVPATQANAAIEAETQEESITGEHVLDGLQLGLDVVGLIPVVGEAADIISAGISLARGDYVGAGLSLLSAIPFVGYAGTAGKATRYGAKMAEASGKVGKEAADRAAKEAADKAAKEAAERKVREEAAKQTSLKAEDGAKIRPKKPTSFTKNGYKYDLDDKGRVLKVGGNLKLNKSQARNQNAQRNAGGKDRLPDDQGGHFIGRRFEGPKDEVNHFAQNGNFNNSSYRKLENSWERMLKDKKDVRIEITPKYTGDSLRPDTLKVKQWIDGIPQDLIIFGNKFGG
ncbi:DNA/RNA non-specific endonuclease [Pseudomonas helleri]|uniref:Type VII secretion system protein EssD-like domain-containing protein n=1 Tax=Pseudomonas helleri TaxID=1608996 RepID=A0A6L5HLQ5_9PSED|nr:DNA/RNA non-specific endonuclease [Pseudomonas helleri]MQU04246.1 hypothetical protein [Pseudomonas helleri]